MKRTKISGVALTELLICLPMLVGVGLGAFQLWELMRWRVQLGYAIHQAARYGVLDHADPISIEAGLARGLAPLFGGATDASSHLQSQAQALLQLQTGKAAGWLQWEQLSPGPDSFRDWAVPAVDAQGNTLTGQMEIPVDNLPTRALHQMPASGSRGFRGAEQIGAASGQTLNDANLLRLEMTFWVPLHVPWVGRVAATIGRATSSCTTFCQSYFSPDMRGKAVPRWPVRVAATMRMQTPTRRIGSGTQPTLPGGPTLGEGTVDPAGSFTPVAVAQLNPNGVDAANDGSSYRGPGFLAMGGQRPGNQLGACGVPP